MPTPISTEDATDSDTVSCANSADAAETADYAVGMKRVLLAFLLAAGCSTTPIAPVFEFSRIDMPRDVFERAADVWHAVGVDIHAAGDNAPLVAVITFPGQHPDYGPVPGVGIPGDRDETTDLAHAFGHMLGLGHAPDGCTMAATPCWSGTLTDSERAELAALGY